MKEETTKTNVEDLLKNKHLISEMQQDENGRDFRMVDGVKIGQIEEKTERDRQTNEAINLWRMRSK